MGEYVRACIHRLCYVCGGGRASTCLLYTSLALVLYAASLFAYGAAVDTVAPLDRHLDEAIISVYRHTPLNAYAEYLQEHFHQQYEKTGGI